jgi:cytochrome b involved in lipid metabolism
VFGHSNENNNIVSKEDIWTIHGEQYDLREFIKRHPGGSRAINLGRSIDCTELFETYHPFTEKHRVVLQKYKLRKNKSRKESKTDLRKLRVYVNIFSPPETRRVY